MSSEEAGLRPSSELTEGIETEAALAVRSEALIALGRRDKALPILDQAAGTFPNSNWLFACAGDVPVG